MRSFATNISRLLKAHRWMAGATAAVLVAAGAGAGVAATGGGSPSSRAATVKATTVTSTTLTPTSVTPTTVSPTTSTTTANAADQVAICAAAVSSAALSATGSNGDHCGVINLKVSTVDPSWVSGTIGLFNAQDQPASDLAAVLFNVSSHQLIGPAHLGFCTEGGPSAGTAVPGYSYVPSGVLASLGLSPCSSSPPSTTSPTTTQTLSAFAAIAGTWGAHEESLTINSNGTGLLRYPDLTACPSCSLASAPPGSVAFTLTSVRNNVTTGSVTASSDPNNWTLGQPVQVSLAAGSPGQLLLVDIGGKGNMQFCNSSSAGQCGA